MKKVLAIIMSMGLMFCLTGCGAATVGDITLEKGQSGFYIKSDGTVQYAVSESFEKDYYDKGDLEDAVNAEIKAYNDGDLASVSDAISVEDVDVSKDVATVKLNFATVYDFSSYIEAYNMMDNEKFYVGTISSNPYELADKFISPEGESTLPKEVKKMDAEIIVVDGVNQVQIEGKVLYTSENCSVNDAGIVTTADKSNGTSYIVYMPE